MWPSARVSSAATAASAAATGSPASAASPSTAVRALARAAGARATFMAKPFQGLSGSSMPLHVSLWREDTLAFAP